MNIIKIKSKFQGKNHSPVQTSNTRTKIGITCKETTVNIGRKKGVKILYNSRDNMQFRRDVYPTQNMERRNFDCNNSRMGTCSVPTPFPNVTPVAMAFVPYQQTPEVYDEMKAFCKGTLFPDLDKPFERCRQ